MNILVYFPNCIEEEELPEYFVPISADFPSPVEKDDDDFFPRHKDYSSKFQLGSMGYSLLEVIDEYQVKVPDTKVFYLYANPLKIKPTEFLENINTDYRLRYMYGQLIIDDDFSTLALQKKSDIFTKVIQFNGIDIVWLHHRKYVQLADVIAKNNHFNVIEYVEGNKNITWSAIPSQTIVLYNGNRERTIPNMKQIMSIRTKNIPKPVLLTYENLAINISKDDICFPLKEPLKTFDIFGQLEAHGLEMDQKLVASIKNAYHAQPAINLDKSYEYEDKIILADPIYGPADINPSKPGAGGIAEDAIIAFLLVADSSIYESFKSKLSLGSLDIFNAIIDQSRSFVRRYGSNFEASFIPKFRLDDPTARVFKLASDLALQKKSKTIKWDDLITSVSILSLKYGHDFNVRPSFSDLALYTQRTSVLPADSKSIWQYPTVSRFFNDLLPERDWYTGDFQYLMTLENSNPVLRVVSPLKDFWHESTKMKGVRVRSFLLHEDNFFGFTKQQVDELNELLKNEKASEHQFQRYFEKYPEYFRKFDFREVFPLVQLVDKRINTKLIPDFILTNREIQRAMILDLKLPTAKMIIHDDNRIRFSQAIMEARAQLTTYKNWFRESANREALARMVGLEIYEPKMAVIIGRSNEFQCPLITQDLMAQNRDIEIITYDEMVSYAQFNRSKINQFWTGK